MTDTPCASSLPPPCPTTTTPHSIWEPCQRKGGQAECRSHGLPLQEVPPPPLHWCGPWGQVTPAAYRWDHHWSKHCTLTAQRYQALTLTDHQGCDRHSNGRKPCNAPLNLLHLRSFPVSWQQGRIRKDCGQIRAGSRSDPGQEEAAAHAKILFPLPGPEPPPGVSLDLCQKTAHVVRGDALGDQAAYLEVN